MAIHVCLFPKQRVYSTNSYTVTLPLINEGLER